MSSLQQRLHVGLISSVVLLMLVLWWLVSNAIERFGEEFVQSRLMHDAESLLSALQTDDAGELQLSPGRMASIYQKPFSGHYFVVLHGNEVQYSRSLWDETLDVSLLSPGDTRHWLETGPSNQPLLVWAGGFQKQGEQITIAIAEDLSVLTQRMARFNWYFAALSLVVLLVLLFIQHYIVRRSFVPLEQIQQDIKNLQQGGVGELTEAVPAEVRPLVREVNHLLRLLSERLQRSRTAMGNLAHALKAPLSLLTQLSQQKEVRNLPEVSAELEKHIQSIRQLMDRQLKRARLMGQGRPGAWFAPQEEMPLLVDVLKRMFESERRRDVPLNIHWQAPDLVFMFDRDDMLELIGNVLDNACKWAKKNVRCELKGDVRHLQFVVEDDGPGCGEDEIEQLLERGVRVDESVDGYGLGLAIVHDIVEIYSGRLSLDQSPTLGGLRVCVELTNCTDNVTDGSG